jgi:hypothetical protein
MDIDVDPIPAAYYWARNTATAAAGEEERVKRTKRRTCSRRELLKVRRSQKLLCRDLEVREKDWQLRVNELAEAKRAAADQVQAIVESFRAWVLKDM